MDNQDLTPQDYINAAFQNRELMERLWCDDSMISNLLFNAVKGSSVQDENNSLSVCCDYFIDYVCVQLIRKPSDFLYVFKNFETSEEKIILMNFYFQNYLVNPNVINALLNNPTLIEQIGDYTQWIEYPLKFRATKLIKIALPQSLAVNDLYPIELELAEDIKDYLLSSAYADNKLSEAAIEYYKEHYSRSYEMLSEIRQNKSSS